MHVPIYRRICITTNNYHFLDQSFKFVIFAMVIFQLFMAYLLAGLFLSRKLNKFQTKFSESSWILISLQAYIVGGTLSHSLTLAVHECSHNLGFGHGKILQVFPSRKIN